MKRGWAPAGAAAAALVLAAVSGGIGPTAALPSGTSPSTGPGPHPGTTAAVAGRSDATPGGGWPEAGRGSTSLQPDFLSGPLDPSTRDDGRGGSDPTDGLAPAVTATFASVRGAYPGSLVVLSAAQQLALQEREGALTGSTDQAPASVHRGSVPNLGVVLDHPVSGPISLSSPFGWRVNPTRIGPSVQFHIGQDYPVACGTPVHAAADGTVRFAADRGTSGLRVDIDHGAGLASAYHHNSTLLVSPGDAVARGDVIALAGTTGNSTGCHVHFGLTLDGRSLDPALVLPAVAGQPAALTTEELQRLRQRARGTTAPPAAESAATPPARASGPRERPSTTPPADVPRPTATATVKPTAKPANPTAKPASKPAKPTARPARATTKPTAAPPAHPTAEPTTPPTETARPTATPSAPPSTPPPTAPPATPAPPEPTEPSPTPEPTPTPTPEPMPPPAPEPTPAPEPDPTEPAPDPTVPSTPGPVPAPIPTPDPTVPAPPTPPALSEDEAARWCVALDPEDLVGERFVITAETVLTEIIAVLDESEEPGLVGRERLSEVDPGIVWLESLPLCTDEAFLAAAAADH